MDDTHPFQNLLDDLEDLQNTLSNDFNAHSQNLSNLVSKIRR